MKMVSSLIFWKKKNNNKKQNEKKKQKKRENTTNLASVNLAQRVVKVTEQKLPGYRYVRYKKNGTRSDCISVQQPLQSDYGRRYSHTAFQQISMWQSIEYSH